MPILICYDGSPSSRRALETAAHSLGGTPAVLLHVWNPPERILADAFGATEHEHAPTYEQLEDWCRNRGDEVLGDGQARAGQLKLSVKPRLERDQSTVWKTILDVADELTAELIVCGTHAATAVESNPLGSVSNALVHHSARPVLIVPSPPRGHSS
jgi:nucleotide-binding universal stress UspA family protein